MSLLRPLVPLWLGACLGLGCATVSVPPAPTSTARAGAPSGIDARLLTFLDEAFDARLALSPQALTELGLKQDSGRLDDYTDAGAQKALALAEAQLARMNQEFEPAALSPEARLSFRLFEADVAQQRRRLRWRSHEYAVSTMNSPAGQLSVFLINNHRVDSVEDARAYVSRLRDVRRVMGEISARLRAQAEHGVVPPQFVFEPVVADTRRVLTGAPFDAGADSVLLADLRKKVDALDAPAEEKARLVDEGREALRGPFREGYDTLLQALADVGARAQGSPGVWSLPDGAAYYADLLRLETTTALGAEEIHALGLAEVARIQGEMNPLRERLGFRGTLREFFTHVKTDARFHYPNTDAGKQAYLADARRFIAGVMEAAPRLFRRLPRAALEVRAVEPWRQETAAFAFYNPPAPDGSRPGIYYVNLADMRQVLQPQVEAVAYHEAAPGHHFQVAIAQELQGVPKFRRFGYTNAYVEGWGLYAEKLGRELGFYREPTSEFGRLSLELWRAARLVVDTGLHAKKWSREQAIAYFQENTLLSERDIVKEVERYLVMPGQATGYKIGELRILELRARAEQALGERFDVRDFHEVVLGSGSLPLDILGEQVDAHIAARRP